MFVNPTCVCSSQINLWILSSIMPSTRHAKTHEDHRRETCIICLKRGDKQINDKVKNYITENIYIDFETHQHILPAGICGTCRTYVYSKATKKIQPVDYDAIVQNLSSIPPLTRQSDKCTFFMCT